MDLYLEKQQVSRFFFFFIVKLIFTAELFVLFCEFIIDIS